MIVNVTRSETWMNDSVVKIQEILDETIADFVPENERIINIEVKESNGLYRFWIYSTRD